MARFTEHARGEGPGGGLDWCRERLLVPGNPLSITLPYAAPGDRDAILALRAVVGEIAAVPGSVSDPEVAARKLRWWGEALEERLPHPAIDALGESGAAARVPDGEFGRLIEAVITTIDPPRHESVDALWRYVRAVAEPAALLEGRLVDDGAQEDQQALAEIAAAGYLIRATRDLVLDARAGRWMVPLELQAEHQLTRSDVVEGSPGRRLDGLVRHLLEIALVAHGRASRTLGPEAAWRHRHQLLGAELDLHLAAKLDRRPGRIIAERVVSADLVGGVKVWRRARRLRREETS